jgi:hypothetical protein
MLVSHREVHRSCATSMDTRRLGGHWPISRTDMALCVVHGHTHADGAGTDMTRWGTDARLVSAGWKRQRLTVLARDCYECAYCGEPANEVDHVISRKDGGTDDLDNLVAACRRCNLAKGAKNERVFLVGRSTPPISSATLSPCTTSRPLSNPFQTSMSQNG